MSFPDDPKEIFAAEPAPPSRRIRTGFFWGVFFCAAFAFHASYAHHGLSEFDTGMLVADVQRVLDGDVFGRDFVAPYGPFRVHALAALFSVFGSSLGVLAWAFALLRALLDLGTFWLARRLLPATVAWAPALAVIVAHGSFHKTFLALATWIFLIPLYRVIAAPHRARCLWLGVGISLSGLIRYDVGVYAVCVSVLCLSLLAIVRLSTWRCSLSHIGWTTVGGTLVAIPVLVYLLARGLDPVYWWEMTWQRIAVQEWIDVGFPWPWERWSDGRPASAMTGIYLLISPLIVIASLVLGLRWLRASSRRREGIWFVALTLMAALLLNQARLIPSLNHFLQGAAPLFVVTATLIWNLKGNEAPRLRKGLATGAIWCLWLVLTFHIAMGTRGPYPGSFTVYSSNNRFLEYPRAGVYVPSPQHFEVSGVLDFLREKGGDDDLLVCSHSCPIYYYLSGMTPAVAYSEPSYYYRNESVQKQMVQGLMAKPPRFFIYDPNPTVGYTMGRDAPILLHALLATMKPVKTIGRYTIYERR